MSPMIHDYDESGTWVSPSPKRLERERIERKRQKRRDNINRILAGIGLVILIFLAILVYKPG